MKGHVCLVCREPLKGNAKICQPCKDKIKLQRAIEREEYAERGK